MRRHRPSDESLSAVNHVRGDSVPQNLAKMVSSPVDGWALDVENPSSDNRSTLPKGLFVTVVQNSLEKLKSAFGSALPLTDNTDYNQIVYGRTNGWDSIAHMTLVAEIETQFEVMLTTEELIALSSFLKAKELLQQHGVTFE